MEKSSISLLKITETSPLHTHLIPVKKDLLHNLFFLLFVRAVMKRRRRQSWRRKRHICLCWRRNSQMPSHCCCSFATRFTNTHTYVCNFSLSLSFSHHRPEAYTCTSSVSSSVRLERHSFMSASP